MDIVLYFSRRRRRTNESFFEKITIIVIIEILNSSNSLQDFIFNTSKSIGHAIAATSNIAIRNEWLDFGET
jgi:hypothetical protein